MREKIKGIVLNVRPHNETLNIVTVYSRSHGRLSMLSPVGSSKGAKVRQARLMPMAVIETEVRIKPGVEFLRLGAFSLLNIWHSLYFDNIKRLQVILLSEFLTKFLNARLQDENLWDYIYEAFLFLDKSERGVNDFHIVFLASLLSFAGIQPDPSQYHRGYFFDMRQGVFTPDFPGHGDVLTGEEARFAAFLLRINFSNSRALRLNRENRNRILSLLLKYYEIHFPGTGNLKSLEILRSLFS